MNDSYNACLSLYRAARPHENSSHADRRAVRTAIAAIVTVGAPAAAAQAASSIVTGANNTAAVVAVSGAKGAFHVVLGGKLLSGVLIGTLLGTAVSTTVYVALPTQAPTSVRQNQSLSHERGRPSAVPESPASNVEPLTPTRAEASASRKLPGESALAAQPPSPDRRRPTNKRETVTPTGARNQDRLIEETQALAEIQDALGRKNPQLAWTLLEEQDRLFSSGQLQQERAAARVMALCAAGRVVEADQARTSFLTMHPNSPLTQRVEKGCDR